MLRDFAIPSRLVALSVQLAVKAAKSSRPSAISGWSRKAASAIAVSFFEQTARSTPRARRAFAWRWRARCASPAPEPSPITMPSSPSSPMTPPQRVLSRSSTRHLRLLPRAAATSRAASSPQAPAASGAISIFACSQRTGSCQRPRPSRAAPRVTSSQSTPPAAAASAAAAFSRATSRAGAPGTTASSPPKTEGLRSRKDCWTTVAPRARPRAQSARSSATAVVTAASAASAGASTGTAPRKSRAARARITPSGPNALSPAGSEGSTSSRRYWP